MPLAMRGPWAARTAPRPKSSAFRWKCRWAPALLHILPRKNVQVCTAMSIEGAATEPGVKLLSSSRVPKVLEEALVPGMRVVTLLNRSGLLLGCAGEAASAASISAIVASLWQLHEKCDGHGALGCLLLECEQGRLAVMAVGSFILACCSDTSVPFGMLRAKAVALHRFLQPSLSQI